VSVRAESPRRPHTGGRAHPNDVTVTLAALLDAMGSTADALASLLEHIPLPAYVFDREARIRWLNAAARSTFGDLVGRPALQFVAPEHVHHAREQFARKVVGGAATAFDLVVLDSDGGRIRVQISSVPLRTGDDVVGIFGVAVPSADIPPGGPPDVALTARQHEVLRLLDEGLGTNELATRMGISVETARNHVRALLRELGVHSRLEAVAAARRFGLIPLRN
jgi:PAS domain S-box-containing protein